VHDVPRVWTDLADRQLFIPDTIYDPEDDYRPLHRRAEPDRWQEVVASDDPVIIKMNGPWSASSSSARWVMNAMLDALHLSAGMRVLEIGTGTGWNAALMAAAGAAVTTVEIDSELADHARIALTEAGYRSVQVIKGDGELGAPAHAPFDRLIATAAVHTIPYAWVSQVVDGGTIVVPYSGEHHSSGLAVLTVTDGAATGPVVHDQAWFMPMRGHGLSQQQLRSPPKGGVRIEVRPTGQTVTSAP
jgi:protein-L-isoaspartate(D-aspartate) O-methyltransferase